MEWFKDFINSIGSTSLERINSPVTGAFAFSWLFWNWKPVLLIAFGESEFEKRLDEASYLIGFIHGFLFPAMSTAAICWLLPFLNKFVSQLQRTPNFETMKMAFDKKKQTLTWDIELAKLSAQSSVAFEEEKATLNLMIAQSQKEAEDTRKQMEATQEIISNLQKEILEKTTEIERLTDSNHEMEKLNQGLKDITSGYDSLSEKLAQEQLEHEKTRQQLAGANSQNRMIHIELQDLKSQNSQ